MTPEPLIGRLNLVRGRLPSNMFKTPHPMFVIYGYADGGALPWVENMLTRYPEIAEYVTKDKRPSKSATCRIIEGENETFFIFNALMHRDDSVSHLIPDYPIERSWIVAARLAQRKGMQIHWQEPMLLAHVDQTQFVFRLFFELINKMDVDMYYYNRFWPLPKSIQGAS